jgi:hypothetical protein
MAYRKHIKSLHKGIVYPTVSRSELTVIEERDECGLTFRWEFPCLRVTRQIRRQHARERVKAVAKYTARLSKLPSMETRA